MSQIGKGRTKHGMYDVQVVLLFYNEYVLHQSLTIFNRDIWEQYLTRICIYALVQFIVMSGLLSYV